MPYPARSLGAVACAIALTGCTLLTDLGSLGDGERATGGGAASGSGGAGAASSSGSGGAGAGPIGGMGGTGPGSGGLGGTPSAGGAGGGGTAPGYADAVLGDGPLAYWRLGDTTLPDAVDETGSYPGNYQGGPGLGQIGALAGDPDTSVTFDGVDDSVLVGDVLDFAGTVPFTLEAWVKPESDSDIVICGKEGTDATGIVGYSLYMSSGAVVVHRHAPDEVDSLYGPVLAPGGFHHVVIAYDGTTMRLYLNGNQVGEAPGIVSMPDTDLPFLIGAGEDGYHFDGGIDEVAVYDYPLNQEQVDAHLSAGIAP